MILVRVSRDQREEYPLVHIVSDEGRVEDEREPLAGQQEQEGDERVGNHLWEDKLRGQQGAGTGYPLG